MYLLPLCFGGVTEGWFYFHPEHLAFLEKAHLEVFEGKKRGSFCFWESIAQVLI